MRTAFRLLFQKLLRHLYYLFLGVSPSSQIHQRIVSSPDLFERLAIGDVVYYDPPPIQRPRTLPKNPRGLYAGVVIDIVANCIFLRSLDDDDLEEVITSDVLLGIASPLTRWYRLRKKKKK